MNPNLQAAADMVKVPEGCVPEYGVTIVSYLGIDAEPLYAFVTFGDSSYSNVMGLLAMASHRMAHLADDEIGEEEEEDDDAV